MFVTPLAPCLCNGSKHATLIHHCHADMHRTQFAVATTMHHQIAKLPHLLRWDLHRPGRAAKTSNSIPPIKLVGPCTSPTFSMLGRDCEVEPTNSDTSDSDRSEIITVCFPLSEQCQDLRRQLVLSAGAPRVVSHCAELSSNQESAAASEGDIEVDVASKTFDETYSAWLAATHDATDYLLQLHSPNFDSQRRRAARF